MLRHTTSLSFNNLPIVEIFKCTLFDYFSQVGWYGIFSVLLIMLTQLHYLYFLISNGLNLATDLSRTKTLPDKTNRKKSKKSSGEGYKIKVLVITREVVYTTKHTTDLASRGRCFLRNLTIFVVF